MIGQDEHAPFAPLNMQVVVHLKHRATPSARSNTSQSKYHRQMTVLFLAVFWFGHMKLKLK